MILFRNLLCMSQAGSSGGGGGGGGTLNTLTGNTGGAVSPTGNNINTVGSGNITVTGNPGTSTLTATLVGTTNHALQLGNAGGSLTSLGVATNGQIPIGSTGADPVLATLTQGTGITITNGAGTITIAASGGSGITSVDTDSGTATPAAGVIEILGTANEIETSGAGNTVTIGLPTNVDITGGLTVGNGLSVTTGGGHVFAGNFVVDATIQGDVITSDGQIVATTYVAAGSSLFVQGNEGFGIGGATAFTNATNNTQGVGLLTILSTTANPGTNTGFLQIYVGTTVAYIPYFTNIAP